MKAGCCLIAAVCCTFVLAGCSPDDDSARDARYVVPPQVKRLVGAAQPYRGPMLARVGKDTVTVALQTRRAMRVSVEYRPHPEPPGNRPVASRRVASQHGRRHALVLRQLRAGTEYRYRLRLGTQAPGDWLPFRTAPEGLAPLRFAFFGDSGTGHPAQAHVAGALAQSRWDLVVHAGDLIYNLGEEHHYTARFFQPYRLTLATSPFYGTLGNHDYGTRRGAPYLRNLVLPNNNPGRHERWYSLRHGAARFICLDSNLSRVGASSCM